VAGIEEQRDIGAFRLLAEVQKLFRHPVAAEVGALDDIEADIAQQFCHRPDVDRRIRQRRHVLVAAVADHESHALVRLCDRRANEKSCQ
jgi:hypothetical protein